jgi:NADH:ubiquinone reductase (H+-translocating)
MSSFNPSFMKKLVIIGGGFAGLKLARSLKNSDFEIWMIDKHNFHQFQPLFYQVATCGLEPSSISFPLRKVFQDYKNFHIRVTNVKSIDPAGQKVHTDIGDFPYDYLVVATGAITNFFGNKNIEENAIPMKSVNEALYLRNKILQNFEDALCVIEEKRKYLLNVVVVGGGPTGVEVSGALAEMKKYILPKDYPEIDFSKMNIYLVEAGPKTLGVMSEESSKKSREYLEKLGVIVYTDTTVKDFDGKQVQLATGKTIPSTTMIWAAGVKGSFLDGLPASCKTKGDRILVDRFNHVEGVKHIFAIGDIASMKTEKYPNGHPQLANVAIQQATHLAKNLKRLKKNEKFEAFEYKDKGSMATVGRNKAVVDLPFLKFQGLFAWLTWMLIHLFLILGLKNKILVFVNWIWKYFTFDESLRLIIKPFKKTPYEQS